MITTGFALGIYNLCKYFGFIKIKNSDEMNPQELAAKKLGLLISGLVMLGIGVTYTLEFLGVW